MKRFFIFILTAALLLSLSSCFMLPDVESMEWAVLTVPEGGANKGDLVIANTSNAAVIPAPEEQASIAEMQSQHTPAIYQNSGLSTHRLKRRLPIAVFVLSRTHNREPFFSLFRMVSTISRFLFVEKSIFIY